jgi:hypothetical protein
MDERGHFLASGHWFKLCPESFFSLLFYDEEMSPFSKVILIFFGKQQSANYVTELQDETLTQQFYFHVLIKNDLLVRYKKLL